MEITFERLAAELSEAARVEWLLPGRLPLARFGPPAAPRRVWWDAGTHGQECATPLALLHFARAEGADWRWPDVTLAAVVVDAEGFDELGYGFVGVDGSRSCWPPLWRYGQDKRRYWTFVDNNSAWGNLAASHLPEEHLALRRALRDFGPTFVYSSHETIWDTAEYDPFWSGCGLLVIETYPLPAGAMQAVIGVPEPTGDPVGFLGYLFRRWAGLVAGRPRWKRNARLLADVPGWRVVSKVMERYKASGSPLMGAAWMRYVELQGDLTAGEARLLHGPEMMEADWLTVTEYAARHFGVPGVTTETFPPGEIGLVGLDWRKAQTFEFVLAVLDALQEWGDET